ncbi:hypothetical protein [Microbacterium capsulatum]|uniref:YbaB/EbfC DNA-binding family protein n=1 Tax=Microbacterium capsulatum TaxID=3041921 RepID=A0ABU0XJH5_9MICO|nr:hypothetical protein [Microbacterium sp. ASV81]MDQ4215273.1 hypothetical protein [Microbacterium sp. ASV81]
MSDDAEMFFELRDEVSRDAQTYADAAGRERPASTTDEAGQIEVTLSETEGTTVVVGDNWQDVYRPGELGSAIVETVQQLAAARTAAWAEGLGEAAEETRRPSPTPPAGESAAARIQAALEAEPDGGAAVTRSLENVLAMLDDISANIDETFAEAFRRGRTTHSTTPLSRNLTVEVSAMGELVSVSFSENWLARTSGSQISRELNAAIAEARAATATSRDAGPFAGTPLAEYQRFLDDPDSFVDYISGRG